MNLKDYEPTSEEMYRNDDIKINFSVPDVIKEIIDILDDLYAKEDDLNYNLYLNHLNAYCKSYYLAGKLTRRHFNALMDRYGAW